MKIHLTKKEYRLLLDILNIADWVMNSRDVPPNISYPKHQALRQKLLSYCKAMSAEDVVVNYDNDYYESREYEETFHEEFIAPYEQDVFWEQLADRLALRDVLQEIGLEKLETLEGLERMTLLGEAAERYEEEFSLNGLKNVEVKQSVQQKNKAVINSC